MNVFLPPTAFAFSCFEKKIVVLEYLVVSENADGALLLDAASHCNSVAFNLRILSSIVAFLRIRQWVAHYASMQFRHLLFKQ